jgi:hypothetical protein
VRAALRLFRYGAFCSDINNVLLIVEAANIRVECAEVFESLEYTSSGSVDGISICCIEGTCATYLHQAKQWRGGSSSS